jgi:hypothetical protein
VKLAAINESSPRIVFFMCTSAIRFTIILGQEQLLHW